MHNRWPPQILAYQYIVLKLVNEAVFSTEFECKNTTKTL